jgi:hypothetical protein
MDDTKQAKEIAAGEDVDVDALLRRFGLDPDEVRRGRDEYFAAAREAVDAKYEKAMRVHEFKQKMTRGGRGHVEAAERF